MVIEYRNCHPIYQKYDVGEEVVRNDMLNAYKPEYEPPFLCRGTVEYVKGVVVGVRWASGGRGEYPNGYLDPWRPEFAYCEDF